MPPVPGPVAPSAQLVLVFGATATLRDLAAGGSIRESYPAAHILGCSTAGEISGDEVFDNSLVCTAIHFEHTQLRAATFSLGVTPDAEQAGEWLSRELPHSLAAKDGRLGDKLVHVLVLCGGSSVNGSALVRGLNKHLPKGVAITGGLAGDGVRFGETLVFTGDELQSGAVAAVGLYGSRLNVGFGSLGGWDPFGPERLVTRSSGNILFELDGRPALSLYKEYLGEHSKGLPATALLFPLSIRFTPSDTPLMRTILAVDEQQQSMTFAGDIPEGARARLSKSNVNRLVDGAIGAAQVSFPAGSAVPDLAILISCVGRKLVLKQRVEEEIDGIREVLGPHTTLAGFYSYGEIAPFSYGTRCELHNQTMTITTFSEN